LLSTSTLISEACRTCEDWTIKDIIYSVGVVKQQKIKSLCMVYGVDYAAEDVVYEKIRTAIKDGVISIPDIEFAETRELGRVNKVDVLGVTYLRVRGMWHIENPFKVFDYIYKRDRNYEFNFMALINSTKYNSLQNTDELEWLVGKVDNFEIKDVYIKNPNNLAKLRRAKLITFKK